STWNAIAGRTENALGNLAAAAEHGRANGAIGYLNTDWGDSGHWQPLPVSYLGFAYGAAMSWCAETARGLDLQRALNVHAFQDQAHVLGGLAYELGNAYKKTGTLVGNNSSLALLLLHPEWPLKEGKLASLTADGLRAAWEHIELAMAPLKQALPDRTDAAQL